MEMTLPITGGCLCGAVRYAVIEQPYWAGYCHCGMCKRAFGGPFGMYVNFRKEAISLIQGEPTLYRSSGSMERGFCGNCGTPLLMQTREGSPEAKAESGLAAQFYPGIRRGECLALAVGSLDHPENCEPIEHVYSQQELAWLKLDDGLPRDDTGRGGPQAENYFGL